MKKLVIIALLTLGVASIEAKGGSAGGAFAGSFMGSALGSSMTRGGSGNGNCDRHEAQIEKYEDKNNTLRKENSRLIKDIKPYRGLLHELKDEFNEWIDDFEEEL